MNKDIEHSFSQDKMHILMPNTQQMMRDKLADSLKEFHQWTDLIRSGEAEVTGLTVKRKRTWVGLTDEEIWETISRIGTSDSNVNPYAKLADARAIEAKLKEKNTCLSQS